MKKNKNSIDTYKWNSFKKCSRNSQEKENRGQKIKNKMVDLSLTDLSLVDISTKELMLLWIRRINIVKMSILTKAIYRFNTINSIQYQATNGIFHRARTNNFTTCMEIQKTSNSQSNLEKEVWNWSNQPA